MTDLNEMRSQVAAMVEETSKILDTAEAEQRDLTPGETSTYNDLLASISRNKAEIAKLERRQEVEALQAEMRATQPRKTGPVAPVARSLDERGANELFRQWATWGDISHTSNAADVSYRSAQHGFAVANQRMHYRALAKSTNTVPVLFSTEFEKILSYSFPVGQAVSVFSTEGGEDITWPTVDDTSNSGEAVAEASGIAVNQDPTFGAITFKRYDYYSPIVKVSHQLLHDSAINVPSLLAELFAERFARRLETVCVSTNAGSSAPEGMLYNVTAGVNLASGNAITYAKLLDLEHSVPIAYRNNPGVAFMMHDATWQGIRALTDGSTNRPLFNNGDIQVGASKQLLGYPVYICNAMTSIASPGDNAPLILFGDLKRYKMRRITGGQYGASLRRLDELYAANGQYGFVQHEPWDARWVTKAGVRTLNSYDAP